MQRLIYTPGNTTWFKFRESRCQQTCFDREKLYEMTKEWFKSEFIYFLLLSFQCNLLILIPSKQQLLLNRRCVQICTTKPVHNFVSYHQNKNLLLYSFTWIHSQVYQRKGVADLCVYNVFGFTSILIMIENPCKIIYYLAFQNRY